MNISCFASHTLASITNTSLWKSDLNNTYVLAIDDRIVPVA
jgi:hypothetical protein